MATTSKEILYADPSFAKGTSEKYGQRWVASARVVLELAMVDGKHECLLIVVTHL